MRLSFITPLVKYRPTARVFGINILIPYPLSSFLILAEREPRVEAVEARPPPPRVPVRVLRRLREERAGAAGLAHLDHVDQRRRPRDAQGQDAQPGRAANGAP